MNGEFILDYLGKSSIITSVCTREKGDQGSQGQSNVCERLEWPMLVLKIKGAMAQECGESTSRSWEGQEDRVFLSFLEKTILPTLGFLQSETLFRPLAL